MGKIRKKGKSGASVAFITRGQAIKKLQLSLKDFRFCFIYLIDFFIN
jgi:hypothetical protein